MILTANCANHRLAAHAPPLSRRPTWEGDSSDRARKVPLRLLWLSYSYNLIASRLWSVLRGHREHWINRQRQPVALDLAYAVSAFCSNGYYERATILEGPGNSDDIHLKLVVTSLSTVIITFWFTSRTKLWISQQSHACGLSHTTWSQQDRRRPSCWILHSRVFSSLFMVCFCLPTVRYPDGLFVGSHMDFARAV